MMSRPYRRLRVIVGTGITAAPARRLGGLSRDASCVKFGRGIFGWALFIGLVVMLFVLLKREQGGAYELSLREFRTEAENGNIQSVTLEADTANGDFVTPPAFANGAKRFKTTFT